METLFLYCSFLFRKEQEKGGRKMSVVKEKYLEKEFYQGIRNILDNARSKSYYAVNFAMVEAYC